MEQQSEGSRRFSPSLTEFVSATFTVLKRNLMLVRMISHFLISDYMKLPIDG
jgi:hypothetical protein